MKKTTLILILVIPVLFFSQILFNSQRTPIIHKKYIVFDTNTSDIPNDELDEIQVDDDSPDENSDIVQLNISKV